VSRGRLCDYSGIDYQLLAEQGAVQWPYPEGATGTDTSRLYTDGEFQTDDRRAKLICAAWEPFPEQPNREYPLILNTGRTVEHWHTRTKTREVEILEHLSPHAWLEMNPRDAGKLGLRSHDRIDLVSRAAGLRRRIAAHRDRRSRTGLHALSTISKPTRNK
jgi:assimilatory nitrate reductase catalytic subunit